MSFIVDIFTPSSVVAKDVKAKSLLVPTSRGEINILKDHTHMVTKLDTGIMTVISDKGERHFLMTAGICKIQNDRITILSQVAENAEDVDLERAKIARDAAIKKLDQSDPLTDIELVKYRRKVERANMRIKVANLK